MRHLISIIAAALLGMVVQQETAYSQGFEKKTYNYNEWAKGKFSEVVTVRNPGTWIFLGGIGPENEGDGKILHKGDFYAQCMYAWEKIGKLLKLHGATFDDIVKSTVYMTDIRHFPEWGKCRATAIKGAQLPASTLLNVSQLAWPDMMVEIDVTAVIGK